jgi:hypothetical protein
MTEKDRSDEAVHGWTASAVVVVAIGMAVVSIFVESLILPLIAVLVAVTGSVAGLFARGTLAGRLATAGGIVAVLLCLAAALLVYGSAMAGMGLAR